MSLQTSWPFLQRKLWFFPKILWMGVFACFLQSRFCKCIPVRRIYCVLGFLLYLRTVDRLVRCSLCFWHRHVGPASMRPTLLSTSRQGRAETGCFGISSPSRWKMMHFCPITISPCPHADSQSFLVDPGTGRTSLAVLWCIILHTAYTIIERIRKKGCHAGLHFVSAFVSN